jgi:hypothetical protein
MSAGNEEQSGDDWKAVASPASTVSCGRPTELHGLGVFRGRDADCRVDRVACDDSNDRGYGQPLRAKVDAAECAQPGSSWCHVV